MYKININDRSYSSWEIEDAITGSAVGNICEPLEKKLFDGDIFSLESGVFTLNQSNIRDCKCIPGVLILDGNKTYGREKKKNKPDGKLLYKCIPDNKKIPEFLVPYELKEIGFSKIYQNLYVTFYFDTWNEKHPQGKLESVIGPVNKLTNFYEYQIFCKDLNISIQKFNRAANSVDVGETHDEVIKNIYEKFKTTAKIQDRRNVHQIFTIDPQGSQDLDDAFSVQECDDGSTIVSIYIANVALILNALNLLDSVSKRTSTIYLPDKKKSMLPPILGDHLCSLLEERERFVFVLDLKIVDGFICETKFSNAIVLLTKNYTYDDFQLLCSDSYRLLKDCALKLSRNYKYLETINDSHDVVSYFMILMNCECAKVMMKCGNGIFRTNSLKPELKNRVDYVLPTDVSDFLKNWNSSTSEYMALEKNDDARLNHELMGLEAYIHITSPIRRLVDLLNMIKIQENLNLMTLNTQFYNNWICEIDYINNSMRKIRKVQNLCSLLCLCSKNDGNDRILYNGYVFNRICISINENDCNYKYDVYLPKIKMVYSFKSRENLDNYSSHSFKIFVFEDENSFKRKVRIQLIQQ